MIKTPEGSRRVDITVNPLFSWAMAVELEEFAPGRWRVKKPRVNEKQRAENMPLPFVISDAMPATEQVDGRFYESKSQFRRVGRQLGLIEVGNEKVTQKKVRASQLPQAKRARRDAIGRAIAGYKEGRRPQRTQ